MTGIVTGILPVADTREISMLALTCVYIACGEFYVCNDISKYIIVMVAYFVTGILFRLTRELVGKHSTTVIFADKFQVNKRVYLLRSFTWYLLCPTAFVNSLFQLCNLSRVLTLVKIKNY